MNLRLLILVCATIIVSVNAGLIPLKDNEKYVNGYRQTNLPMETLSVDPILKLEFDNYKLKHNKTYPSIDEENVRFVNFISSFIEIDRHNELMRKGQKLYTMAVNHFSDWTKEEFHKLNGLLISNMSGSWYLSPNVKLNLPEYVDWREKGAVTDVKNQNRCGSCWAFSATEALEGQIWRKTGKLISLSEQQIVDCDLNGNACQDGCVSEAFDYVKRVGGIEKEEDYPYISKYMNESRHKCNFGMKKSVALNTGFVILPAGDEEKLREAVAIIGPISIGISAAPSLSKYINGIYHDDICGLMKINHAVLLVGYGTDQSTRIPYWLIKNSWGPNWGENGYFRMERNIGSCHIGMYSTYPLI